ncbi:hypothetical protein AB0L41_12550 [Amycolatopsis mediterranei]|uniref:hypothetical protein n=1 Tax=Amycolatopsis mediterranei TaxID=33910 RepID=UPI003418D8E1
MEAKQGVYLGASAGELHAGKIADKAAGVLSQKALFRRRGTIELAGGSLVLSGWDEGALVLRPGDVTSLRREFTDLYGRFLGGLTDSGKPLVLGTTTPAGELYLLIDRKEFMESTRNKEWAEAIEDWRHGTASGPPPA